MIHMIINLNMIFCTHVEHSPTKTIYIKYYTEKQTHTPTYTQTVMNSNVYDTDQYYTCVRTHTNTTSRNWVLILIGLKILWEEEGFQSGFKR